MSAEIGRITPSMQGLSWKITFLTDYQGKINEVNNIFIGDIMRFEEYDFEDNSINLI
jgi:hypothetical protein